MEDVTMAINELSISTCVFGAERGPGEMLGDYMELALNAGFKMVEISHAVPEKESSMNAFRNSGIKVWSIHGVMGMGAISPDKAERDKAVELAYRHAAGYAEFAPCPLVEHYLDRHSDRKVADYYRYSIEKLFEKVSALGYILCIETAPYKPKEYDRHPNSMEIAEFIRSFNSPQLQMTVDINHSNLYENLLATADITHGLVKNIHVSNNYGICENHLPPDIGVIDIKQAFDALRLHGYAGPCNLEFSFPGQKGITPTLTQLMEVRRYMEKLLWNR